MCIRDRDSLIAITITFSEVVNVSGTPQLTLETGSSDAVVNYSSGSGSTVLTFNYTVASGHTSSDLDLAKEEPLDFHDGFVRDLAVNYAIRTLPGKGAANSLATNKDLVIDGVSPTISSVSLAADNSTIAVTMSEAVYNTDGGSGSLEASDFSFSTSSTSLSFDGSDYVSLDKMNVSNSNGVTFSLWVKANSLSTSWSTVLRQDINGNPDFMLQFVGDNKISYGFNSSLTSYSELDISINSSDYIDKWVHLVGTYVPSTSIQYLYVNGSQAGSNNNHSGVGPSGTSNYKLYIGSTPHNTSEFFNGKISEVAIWNDALSSTEAVSYTHLTLPTKA